MNNNNNLMNDVDDDDITIVIIRLPINLSFFIKFLYFLI